MLIAMLPAAILQVGAGAKPSVAPTWEAAHPALMAKAPGAPGYGVQFTTTSGKLVFTNLQFDSTTRQPLVEIYRILGNAGSGPYRLGLELGFVPKRPPYGNSIHPSWSDNYYYILSSEDGSPAKAAGLEPGKRGVYQVQTMASDPVTGRLTAFNLRPWEADILPLLGGQTMAKVLGTMSSPEPRESLEQLANRALLEWKTRTLPGRLAAQSRESAEDLVLRIEQGLLDLDLEVKGIRSRIDATARAEAERKAQAELAARDGKAAPQVQASPATESERLADLLEQRKAILMAILGSAKQALANLRR